MKYFVYLLLVLSSLFLVGCGTGKKKIRGEGVEKQKSLSERVDEIITDTPEVTSGDVVDFNVIVGGSRETKEEGKESVFTFREDNTFTVVRAGKALNGPRIVSEGKILLGEDNLELDVINESEIKIKGVVYSREKN